MRCLIVDQDGVGLDMALRFAQDGHEVRLYQYNKPGKHNRASEGFKGIKRVDDWRSSVTWAKDGLIIPTVNNRFLKEFDAYREHGIKIFGPTYQSALLEIERAKGLDAMQAAGIDVPHFETFSSLAAAEAFARKSDQAYVFKTMGDEEDKSLSYVASDPADLVGWLQRKQAQGYKLKGECMLQEKIDMVAEVGVSGWCGPKGFLENKWQICFEHKKLMSGEYGPNTGEQGTVCQYVEADKMAEETLIPMEKLLMKLGHCGDFAIGCGVDSKGKAWPFEFTCRLGWPAFFIQMASHKGDSAQWMRDLLDGKDTLKVDRRVAIGVVLAQPRYPYGDSDPSEVEGNPIAGAEKVWDQVHPCDMMIGKGPVMKAGKVVEAPIYQTSGEYVMVVTGLGNSVEAARKDVYGAAKEIKFSNKMLRDDIGLKVIDKLPELHKMGYAMEMKP